MIVLIKAYAPDTRVISENICGAGSDEAKAAASWLNIKLGHVPVIVDFSD